MKVQQEIGLAWEVGSRTGWPNVYSSTALIPRLDSAFQYMAMNHCLVTWVRKAATASVLPGTA